MVQGEINSTGATRRYHVLTVGHDRYRDVLPFVYPLSLIFDLGRPCIWVYLPIEAIMNDLWSYFWSYLAVVISLVTFLGILGWIVWVCALDARRRGKSPFLVSLLVFVSFPLGLILWLLFRPEPLNERRRQELSSNFPLSDDEIRECLKLEGPPVAH